MKHAQNLKNVHERKQQSRWNVGTLIALPTGCTHVTLTFYFVFGTVLNIWESDCIKSHFNNLFTAISVQVNRQKSENYRRNKP